MSETLPGVYKFELVWYVYICMEVHVPLVAHATYKKCEQSYVPAIATMLLLEMATIMFLI